MQRAVQARHLRSTARASKMLEASGTPRRGLVVPRGRVLHDRLVQVTFDGAAQRSVLRLSAFRPFDLVAVQVTELLPLTVIGHVADADRADRGQHANLAQPGDNLFRL